METRPPTQEARKCGYCGEVFFSNIAYCLNCGQPLEIIQTLVGKTLDDRYQVTSLLGSGGMGTVYRARHIHLESDFAIKVLNPELVADEAAIERFRREAKAARMIHHPNAIEVTDFGVTDDKTVYIVMEIVEGHSLRQIINDGVIEYPRAVEILSQVCEAVEAAHHKKVIHRDLKPDNVIVTTEDGVDKVKVLDFGIAKLLETDQPGAPKRVLTKAGMLIGTPQYMSPEQCRGEVLEAQSDIYSLGIIAYEMLAGKPPFLAEKPREFIAKHLRELPPSLRDQAPQIPVSLERVIMRALEKAPSGRQASALEFARELRQAAAEALAAGRRTTLVKGEKSSATSTGPNRKERSTVPTPPPIQKDGEQQSESASPPKPRWLLIAAAAGLVAILGLVIWFNPFFGKKEPAPAGSDRTGEQGEMALIPGGRFTMGRNDGDEDERPAREVEVKSFYLDKFEVTNQQYKKFVEATGYRIPGHWTNNGSYAPEEAQLPVTHVTWNDATAYARWAKKRLPTEAEWEYAARGGNKGLLYPWGNEWKDGFANVNRGGNKPAPVHSFEDDRNASGVYDLAGNVSEWVDSLYISYANGQLLSDCRECRVYRGGNYKTQIKDSNAAHRWSDYPDVPTDARSKAEYEEVVFPIVGFRCARSVE